MRLNVGILGAPRKKPLVYENWINLIVWVAKFLFNKHPFDLGDVPVGIYLEEFVNLMWKLAIQKNDKQLLLLFSNQNKQNIRMQILNNILKEDPQSELPDVFYFYLKTKKKISILHFYSKGIQESLGKGH